MFTLQKQGAVFVVTASDQLNAESAPQAASVFDQCFGKGQPRIVFDMQALPLLDSRGLELLWDIRDRCVAQGGALVLAAPNELCREILRVTQLQHMFAIFDHRVAAVGSFAQ